MTALKIDLTGNGSATVTRHFNATPEQVFRAHVEADLIRLWMGGMEGWDMTHCESDARAGGTLRYGWANEEGHSFDITGEYEVVTPFSEIRHVERMHIPDPTPDNRCHTTFEPKNGGTLLTLIMQMPDEESLKAMLDTGMEQGMEDSYSRIDGLF